MNIKFQSKSGRLLYLTPTKIREFVVLTVFLCPHYTLFVVYRYICAHRKSASFVWCPLQRVPTAVRAGCVHMSYWIVNRNHRCIGVRNFRYYDKRLYPAQTQIFKGAHITTVSCFSASSVNPVNILIHHCGVPGYYCVVWFHHSCNVCPSLINSEMLYEVQSIKWMIWYKHITFWPSRTEIINDVGDWCMNKGRSIVKLNFKAKDCQNSL